MNVRLSRRGFLAGTSVAVSGLVIGFHLPAGRALAATEPARLNSFVIVHADDTVEILVGYAEMGQGIVSSLPQTIADEMEADFAKVRTAFAPADMAFANPVFGAQATGGSTTTRGSFDVMRRAGATARDLLEQAAAAEWGVPAEEVKARQGRLVHEPSGREMTFGAVAAKAAGMMPRESYPLKEPSQWRLIGASPDRLDLPAKVRGEARFGIDVRLDGMLVATIAQAPVFGGRLRNVDPAPAMAVRGVRKVVPLENAVAVVADGYWPAKKGLDALSPEWEAGHFAGGSSEVLLATFRAALDRADATAEQEGDAEAALATAARVIEAEYRVPYLAHATMEPMNATARVSEDRAELWVPTQGQSAAQRAVAAALGIAPEKVEVHTTFLGGGFGRRSETDFSVQAALVAKAVGAPVKLIWSREEDMAHDFYRPASAARYRIGLDGNGRITAYDVAIACPSILSRLFPGAVRNGIDSQSVEGAVELPYDMPARRVRYAMTNTPVPVGFWRSVGNSQNGFFTESAIDEAAHAAGQDPLAFRLANLKGSPRHAKVLEAVAEAANWGKAGPGRFQGIAMVESFGSVVAEVVELSLGSDREIVLHRITVAADPGLVVNPRIFDAQLQSAVVYGLTAALYGEITVKGGRVEQGNFDTYEMVHLGQLPPIETLLLPDGTSRMGGAGEVGLPPLAPALANAIFAATGERIRELPLMKHGYSLGSAVA